MTPALTPSFALTLARRAQGMNPSVIREILKVTEQPGVLSLAGGLPASETFPIDEIRVAIDRVMRDSPQAALQYATSEGHRPLREWVVAHLEAQGVRATVDQVLITSGSQQGLDLVGKVLVEADVPLAVEAPTYLGALQAFTPYEPRFHALHSDADGPLPESLADCAGHARLAYLLPNFQNPTGRCFSAPRRQALMEVAERRGLAIVEDNPYGELWFDAPPPAPLAALWPEGTTLLGSFSKVLAPGLRLGYVVAPSAAVGAKLLQAKQAADLHTSGLTQRVVLDVLTQGSAGRGGAFLDRHLPAVRARYQQQRDAMHQALQKHLPPGFTWQLPQGGMFFWLKAPSGIDTLALLPKAVAAGVAYVPGAAFYADSGSPNARGGTADESERARHLRLSFVTLSADRIDEAVRRLAGALAVCAG